MAVIGHQMALNRVIFRGGGLALCWVLLPLSGPRVAHRQNKRAYGNP
jgi:hypothetical protein